MRLLGPWAKYLFAMVRRRTRNLYNLVDINMGWPASPLPQEPALPVSAARHGRGAGSAARARVAGRAAPGGPANRSQRSPSRLGPGAFRRPGRRAWSTTGPKWRSWAMRGKRSGPARCARGRQGRSSTWPGKPACRSWAPWPRPAISLVSNDTGTIHVAAAVGTPTLGLFFASAYFSETAPYGAGHAVLQVEIPCSPCSASTRCAQQVCRAHLPVAEVHQAARWMLRPGSEPPRLPPTLALYRSRFLANGTLLYAPVREETALGPLPRRAAGPPGLGSRPRHRSGSLPGLPHPAGAASARAGGRKWRRCAPTWAVPVRAA